MSERDRDDQEDGSVHIGGQSVNIGGDVVGRDKITTTYGGLGSSDVAALLAQWQAQMNAQVAAQPNLSPAEKQDVQEQVAKIKAEASRGKQADTGRLEKLINTLGVMAPDIFEVALATLANPLAGLGLVAKKIGDKAKLESKAQS